jgi:hypothetical protein
MEYCTEGYVSECLTESNTTRGGETFLDLVDFKCGQKGGNRYCGCVCALACIRGVRFALEDY